MAAECAHLGLPLQVRSLGFSYTLYGALLSLNALLVTLFEVPFARVRETALIVRDGLEALGMPSFAKTTGSRGIHVYVPIVRGPTQRDVWSFAKRFAQSLEALQPRLITAEYVISKRPANSAGRGLNRNSEGVHA